MKVVVVAVVALLIGFLTGLLLSDINNPTLHDVDPPPGTRAFQKK